jgi:hypothetical protein
LLMSRRQPDVRHSSARTASRTASSWANGGKRAGGRRRIATQPPVCPRAHGLSRWVARWSPRRRAGWADARGLRSLLDGFPWNPVPFRVSCRRSRPMAWRPEARCIDLDRDSETADRVAATRCGSSVWGYGPQRTSEVARARRDACRGGCLPWRGAVGGSSRHHGRRRREASSTEPQGGDATVEAERAPAPRTRSRPLGPRRRPLASRAEPYMVATAWRHARRCWETVIASAAGPGRGASDRDGSGCTALTAPWSACDRSARPVGQRGRHLGAGAPWAGDPFVLTRRERDVLPLLVRGRTNRRREELFISERPASMSRTSLASGATTRTEAAGSPRGSGSGLIRRAPAPRCCTSLGSPRLSSPSIHHSMPVRCRP